MSMILFGNKPPLSPPAAAGGERGKKGIALIEIIIAVAIIAVSLGGLLGVAAFSLRASNLIKETALANNLAQETIEAVRNFRDGTVWDADGLGTLNVGDANPYYPQLDISSSPAKWSLAEGEEEIGDFLRKVIFENVSRDPGSGDIEQTYDAGHNDPKTRKVIAAVSWKSKKVEITTYLANWKQ